MYWSPEDHHRQNYYTNLQSVQHQNGLQQATAAMPPHQQQLATQPTILQQQQQQHQQQQQQQQQHQPHRPAPQIQSHFANQQQFQHHQQWSAGRPAHILTVPPFLQQYPNSAPSSTQFCAPPPNYYQTQPQYPQTSAVSATPQQRQCLPQGCTVYTMPPQATAMRQSVITQPPPNIMTPTTSAAQQMQVQYFPTFCQPPLLGQQAYGHVMTPALSETHVAKPRKYAIPIIHPETKENIMERKYRSNESPDADGPSSITTTPSSTSIDELKEPINDVKEEDEANDDKQNNIEEIIEEAITDASPTILDHVDSIEPKDEEVDEVEIKRKTPCEELSEEAGQIQSSTSSIVTTPNDTQTEKIGSGDDDVAPPPSPTEGNISAPLVMEPDDESPVITESTEEKPASLNDIAPDEKVEEDCNNKHPTPLVSDEKVMKQSKTQPTTTATLKKTKKNSKRLKESQKKQKADLMKSENNNTNKATNQNENNKAKAIDKVTDSCNSTNRLKIKAKESSKNTIIKKGEITNTTTATKITTTTTETTTREATTPADVEVISSTGTTTATLDTQEYSEESSLQVDNSTETPNTYDENDHSLSLQPDDSLQLYKSEEIASKIFGIESTDDNELLFLNSSVSGYEDELSPSSPTKQTRDNEKIQDILFGDFSEAESSPQELLCAELNETIQSKENEVKDGNRDGEQVVASSINDFKEKKYTLDELRSLAHEPASKLPPPFRGQICEIIGKNPGDGLGLQHNKFFPQMSYKDSISLNRRRNKQPFQQQQQQQQFDNQQLQQQQQQQQGNRDIIRIYLPLNEDVKLAESENAWVPQALKDFGPKIEENDEQILKKIRGILNKLTPENFDKLLQSASSFPMKSVERIQKVMLLIFEKTVSEPNFAPTYARFCRFLFNPEDSNHAMFKTILIKRIQEEFDTNVNNSKAKEAKLKPLMDRLAAVTDAKEKQEIKAEIDDQEYQFRRRAWGTVRFIGEMGKMGFIRTDRVCACVEGLLDVRCEEKLEFMCKLLTTVGPQLETASQQPGYDKQWAIKERLDRIFTKIRQVIEKKNQGNGQKISSRVRFMLQDIVDLRARLWDQKDSTTAPLPPREVSPAMTRGVPNSQQQRGPRSFMPSMSGGYDKKRLPNNENQQKTTSIDRSKLSFNFSDEIKLGNSSPLMWQVTKKSQQQQRQTAPANSNQQSRPLANEVRQAEQPERQDLSDAECERLLNGLIEMVGEGEDSSEWFLKWKSIPAPHQICIINYVLTEYLHLRKCELELCTQLFVSLFKEKLITRNVFTEGYAKFSETWYDILLNDEPNGWTKIFKFLGPSLHLEFVEINNIWDKTWFNTVCGDRFLQSMIVYFTSEFGANYMRYFWENNSLRWNIFLQEDKIPTFIAKNGFKFIDDLKCTPPMFIRRNNDELVQRIKELLAQSSQDLVIIIDLIIDFISTNVHIDCEFVRSLTMFLCDYSVIYSPNNKNSSNSTKKSKTSDNSTACSTYKLRTDIFNKNCIPLLRLCIDSNDEHEMSCLNAIVAECNRLSCDKFPVDLMNSFLAELYGVVISKESFEKWREQLSTLEGGISKELDAFFRTLPI